uniref:Uncharacterized protein n=1 Tax=Daucus carota subsp. sativus TaxID=79200 RepID=A0A166CQK3_DAUCS
MRRFNCRKRISMCVKRRVSPIESNESNTEKKAGLELKSNESKRKRVWSWRVESVGDNFTTPPMSSKRKSRYIGPILHEWTAEQEELVIVSFISSLNSDMGRPDYLKKMTWSEIKQRAIELYRVKFGQEPYVTANKIKNKVDWLRDAYDQKDTSMSSKRKSRYIGPTRHEWTAEQEELVIVSFISSLNSDMGRPDYLKKMTWSEIKQRAIELYRVKFGQEPYVTANKIKNKVDWLRDAYDQKDTSLHIWLHMRLHLVAYGFKELKNLGLEEDIYYSVYPKMLSPEFRTLFLDCDTPESKLSFIRSYSFLSTRK